MKRFIAALQSIICVFEDFHNSAKLLVVQAYFDIYIVVTKAGLSIFLLDYRLSTSFGERNKTYYLL